MGNSSPAAIYTSITNGKCAGEIGAAYAAGKISANRAITTAYFRGKVAASLDTQGAMLAVGLGADEAAKYILEEASYREKVTIGCYNSPSSVTLSGDRDAIERLEGFLNGKKIFARVLKTGGKAYHSYHMEEAAARYAAFLRAESTTDAAASVSSNIPMFSTVRDGYILDHNELNLDTYWAENLNSPVLFEQGIQLMLQHLPKIDTLIEIGPHAALQGPIRQICLSCNRADVIYLPSLKRNKHDGEQMLTLAGKLWQCDFPIDLNSVLGIERIAKNGTIERQHGSLLVDLPTYHWTYTKSYWTESRSSKEHRNMQGPRHDLLGRRVIGASPLEPLWRNILRQQDLPWLVQHRLGGEVMMPAAGYISLAIEAITQVNADSNTCLEIQSYTLSDVVISTATVIPYDDVGVETLFRLRPLNSGGSTSRYQFMASFCFQGTWKETARGTVSLNVTSQSCRPEILPDTPKRELHIEWLNKLRALGIDLGPAFHWISNVYSDGRTCTARADLSIAKECGLMEAESRYVLHPTVFDSCLQPGLISVHQGRIENMRCGTIPTHFREVTIFPPLPGQLANRCSLQVWTPRSGNRAFKSNSQLIAHDGSLIVDISGARHILYEVAIPHDMQGDIYRDLYLKLDWKIDADYLINARKTLALAQQPIAALVDILLHKDVTRQVLCLDESLVESILAIRPAISMALATETDAAKVTAMERYTDYESLSIIKLHIDTLGSTQPDNRYGLIISPKIELNQSNILKSIQAMATDNGRILIRTIADTVDKWDLLLKSNGFSGVDECLLDNIILTTAVDLTPTMSGNQLDTRDSDVFLIYKETPTSLFSSVSNVLTGRGWNVVSKSINSVAVLGNERVVLLVDAEGPFLAQLQSVQLRNLIALTENAKAITWVTCGGLLNGDKPEYGMTEGAARVIRNEKGSLDLVTMDCDEDTPHSCVADLIHDILTRQRARGRNGETEYYLYNGIVHIGRLVPHRELLRNFVPYSGETIDLHQRDHPAIRGDLETGALVFRRDDEQVAKPLEAAEVEVHVAAMGITFADADDDLHYLNHEIAGTAVRVGANVQDIAPGAKVVGFAFDRLGTFQRTSSQLLTELSPCDPLTEAASLPSAFVTAMYGLEELARVQSGENVVILDGMGGVSQAACQLCHLLKANPIMVTSAGSVEVPHPNSPAPTPDSTCGTSAVSSQLDIATAGRGVDILFYPATVDEAILIQCVQSLAQFGRIVSVGRASGPAFATSATFLAKGISSFIFNLYDVAEGRKQLISRSFTTLLYFCRSPN